GIAVDRWDGGRRLGKSFGRLVDLSAGGVRIRTEGANAVKPDSQIRVRLSLPDYAGICPFVDTTSPEPKPKREWIGWMTVNRVIKTSDGKTDVAGRLVDMEDMDRGMLGLYLSTQPLAA
ncbi:MAG TPA: PilZ domain-containing protein, partial [Tepidisphaeraceae bacterium]|nr:PilZ domain-containing protein [Tepidisphaeraceae bacterium]